MLHYFPLREHDFDVSPTTLDFEHYVTEAQLADLFQLAQHGRFPSRLNIHVADDLGMKYGWEPDGSGKEWDTASSPHVLIESFSFEITIAEPPAAVPPPFDAVLLPVLYRMLFWQQLTFISVLLIGILLLLRR